MSISKTKNYLVLNYGHSPVGISTRHENYLIPGADGDTPASLPLTIDEIQVVNSNSPVFKVGILRFEEKDEKDIYEELRILNWQDILTDQEIEEILLNPDAESLQGLVSIESEPYYERIRGVYMGLKGSGAAISLNVSNAIEARRDELIRHKRTTDIRVTANSENQSKAASSEEVDDLKRQLAEMQAMMAKMMEGKANNEKPAKKGTTTKK